MSVETIIAAALPIVDAHHHLWETTPPLGERAERRYRAEDFRADIDCGHNVTSTVYVECHSGYRSAGPEALRTVGETEYVIAECARVNRRGLCAGIIGFADMLLGDLVTPVLEAHLVAGLGRFRGIRYGTLRDEDSVIVGLRLPPRPRGLTETDLFRTAFSRLAPLNLSFDALVFHTQLLDIRNLARSFPDTLIVVEHAGNAIGIGHYAHEREEVRRNLRSGLIALSSCPNVYVKLGGLGMFLGGSPLLNREPEPEVSEIAAEWGPIIHFCIERFGVDRCMFESNFPLDNAVCSYRQLWNVFKYITSAYSGEERRALFSKTAEIFYRITATETSSPDQGAVP